MHWLASQLSTVTCVFSVSQVAVKSKLYPEIFPPILSRCKHVTLGGDVTSGQRYQGYVSQLRVWRRALTREQIRTHVREHTQVTTHDHRVGLFLDEDFHSLQQWTSLRGEIPLLLDLAWSEVTSHSYISTPPCGETVCDNPDVVKSYAAHAQLRSTKRVRYRVVNLMNDDGSDAIVTDQQIADQHDALTAAFQVSGCSNMICNARSIWV